ncbi:MAG: hypothetical protein H0V67_03170 [Geodermatophilaceae bacterium]|nr:hypothetical protein [Geodermatophilaceae bacterium]
MNTSFLTTQPLTLFSWGYWGWGSATKQLLEGVDAVETSRGYKPPMFVDIRLSRSVRAAGFNGNAFEKTVGPSRYRWLDDLGNLGIQDGGPMRIKNPAAVNTLLEIAEKCAVERQRVLFFCSCAVPGVEAKGCHRTVVGRLLLEAAAGRAQPFEVIEWPGGDPTKDAIDLKTNAARFGKIRAGAVSIPIDEPLPLAEMAAIPWYSLCRVYGQDDSDELLFLTGPVCYKKSGWYLPMYGDVPLDMAEEEIPAWIDDLRKRDGFVARRVEP